MPRELPWISSLDSTTTLLLGLAARLHGHEFARLGILPPIPPPLARLTNRAPSSVRLWFYKLTAVIQSSSVSRFHQLDVERICGWTAGRYPAVPFPGAAIGFSNGAVMYLLAAMGLPWLPQTFLLPVGRLMGPDDIEGDLAWGRDHVKPVLRANPLVFLQQMHDPLQDRLMIQRMAMFRLKLLGLPQSYSRFLA